MESGKNTYQEKSKIQQRVRHRIETFKLKIFD